MRRISVTGSGAVVQSSLWLDSRKRLTGSLQQQVSTVQHIKKKGRGETVNSVNDQLIEKLTNNIITKRKHSLLSWTSAADLH